MMAYSEVYLRCPQLANASRVLGNLGDDILSKITLKSGVGTIALMTGILCPEKRPQEELCSRAGESCGEPTAGWEGSLVNHASRVGVADAAVHHQARFASFCLDHIHAAHGQLIPPSILGIRKAGNFLNVAGWQLFLHP